MKRKRSILWGLAAFVLLGLAVSACGKGGGDNDITVNNGNGGGTGTGTGGGSGGGSGSGGGTTAPIPTKVMGILEAALVNLPSDNGAASRIEMDNGPFGHYYKTSLTGTGVSTTIRIKNANSEPRIDSASGVYYAYYPNIRQGRPDEVTAADTVSNLCFVVNNGTTRWVMVMCEWSNVFGSGGIFCPAVTDHFYRGNNAFINDKINNSTGLKEVLNTLP